MTDSSADLQMGRFDGPAEPADTSTRYRGQRRLLVITAQSVGWLITYGGRPAMAQIRGSESGDITSLLSSAENSSSLLHNYILKPAKRLGGRREE